MTAEQAGALAAMEFALKLLIRDLRLSAPDKHRQMLTIAENSIQQYFSAEDDWTAAALEAGMAKLIDLYQPSEGRIERRTL